MTDSVSPDGLVVRTAVASLVGLRLAQGTGPAPPDTTTWRDELSRVQREWELRGRMPDASVLAHAVDRLFARVTALPASDRGEALAAYASGRDDL